MVKSLKFIALTLACSSVAYGFAFWQSAPPQKKVYPVARKINLREGFTPIQDALTSHIIHEGSYLVDITKPPVQQRMVVAQNYLLMLLQSPSQQANMLEMIQVDRLFPSPSPWDRVRKAPGIADAILRVTDAQRKQFAEFDRKGYGTPPLGAAPGDWIQARRAQLAHQRSVIRPMLTKAQREEWDEILAKVESEFAAARKG